MKMPAIYLEFHVGRSALRAECSVLTSRARPATEGGHVPVSCWPQDGERLLGVLSELIFERMQ